MNDYKRYRFIYDIFIIIWIAVMSTLKTLDLINLSDLVIILPLIGKFIGTMNNINDRED